MRELNESFGYEEEAGIKLQYPIDDWMERLIAKYPCELAGVMPDAVTVRDDRQLLLPLSEWTNAA